MSRRVNDEKAKRKSEKALTRTRTGGRTASRDATGRRDDGTTGRASDNTFITLIPRDSMLAENVFQRRGVEPTTTVPTSHHHHHHHDHDLQLRSRAHAHRATCSASSASPPMMMDDRSPLASPSRVVTGFAASAASSYDGGPGGGGPGAGSPPVPVASPRARAVARALLGEALDADAKTRRVVVGLGGVMDATTTKTTTAPMDDSMKSDVSVLSGSLYDDDAVGGRPRSLSREEDEEEEDAVNCGGFARSSPIDIPTWDRKPAHWKTCV